MAKLGISIGQMLSHVATKGPSEKMRRRIDNAVEDSPYKEDCMNCLKAAEEGKKFYKKYGKFAECNQMVTDLAKEDVIVNFTDGYMIFSW